MEYSCKFCDKKYKFKCHFDRHIIACEFFYKSNREFTHEQDNHEQCPTNQMLYRFVQQLALQCQRLETEVERLKLNSNVKQKKSIIHHLNRETNENKYVPWIDYQYQIIVSTEHLQIITENTVIDGIKQIICDDLENLPIKAYKEKLNTLFVYGFEEEKWTIFGFEDFCKWIKDIKHVFLQKFLQNTSDGSENTTDGDETTMQNNIEKNIIIMRKIMGGNTEKEAREIFKWLYDKISI